MLFTLSPKIWLWFCNHCNLACFLWSNSFEHSSLNYILCSFNLLCYRLSSTEILIFLPTFSKVLLISTLASKLQKAANSLETLTWYYSLSSTLFSFFGLKSLHTKTHIFISLSFATMRYWSLLQPAPQKDWTSCISECHLPSTRMIQGWPGLYLFLQKQYTCQNC
jgi:hypothetical protein